MSPANRLYSLFCKLMRMALYFRHKSPRPHQKELMEDLHRAVSLRQIIIANAPTGSGKTDAALSAAISCAIEQDLSVFFLTPKISQHKIAMEVVRDIEAKHSLGLRAVDMVGRSHCCIDEPLQGLDSEGLLTSCVKKRQKGECVFYGNARGYNRYQESKADARFRRLLAGYGSGKSHHELIELGRKEQCCPYEWLLKLASESKVIVADYHHIMLPHIRDIFLMKIRKRIEDSVIIVDEAHNLAPRVRSSLSRNISTFAFARAAKEMRYMGLDAGPIEEEFRSWGSEILGGSNERLVSADDFLSFLARFGLDIEEAVSRLEDSGIAFVEQTGRKCACLRLARFIAEWEGDDGSCVRILRRERNHLFLSKSMLDPSSATKVLNDCASGILMSGSMLPMTMHRDVLGLAQERTSMKSYPSPFESSSITNIITEDLTTRYSRRGAEEYSQIASRIDAIVSSTPGGTAIFFPSYQVMDDVLPMMLSRSLIVQRPGMRPPEIRKLLSTSAPLVQPF